jgi:hypothetical protein
MIRIRNVFAVYVGKPEGEKPRISDGSIKMRSIETECEDVVWIHLTKERDK